MQGMYLLLCPESVGGFLALHRPMVTLPPLAPTEHKLKGEELALYQFILISWSKGQSISRVFRCWCHDC